MTLKSHVLLTYYQTKFYFTFKFYRHLVYKQNYPLSLPGDARFPSIFYDKQTYIRIR